MFEDESAVDRIQHQYIAILKTKSVAHGLRDHNASAFLVATRSAMASSCKNIETAIWVSIAQKSSHFLRTRAIDCG